MAEHTLKKKIELSKTILIQQNGVLDKQEFDELKKALIIAEKQKFKYNLFHFKEKKF